MKYGKIVLENEITKLTPLTLDNYKHLFSIAAEHNLVQYSPATIATKEGLKNYVEKALELERKQLAIPLIIFDKRKQQYAGSTRYMYIDQTNKVLHIGATWIGREFQGSGLNAQIKQLMLDHAFGPMGFEKVEFRVDRRNIRSRKAVEKLGAIHEGILRANVYLPDGHKRDTCCYGILKEEWENR